MPIKVTCPKCQGVLHAPDDAGGKRGKCPTCGTVLAIPADGPKASPGVPAAAPPPVAARPAVGEPAFKAPAADPAPAEPRRSSFGLLPDPAAPAADVRRSSAGRLPPPAFGPADPRKASTADPFARAGKPAAVAAGPGGEALARSWRRARRGLGLVQLAAFLYLVAAVARPALDIAQTYGVALPDQTPGYLGQERLSARQEILTGAVVVPAAVGLFFLALGRLGAGNAPRSSYAKGPALAAGLATLLMMVGVVAAGAAMGGQLAAGFDPLARLPDGTVAPVWLPADEPAGLAQRIGLGLVAVFAPLAEVWFVSALGRFGANLQDARAVRRHTRFLLGAGLLVALAGFAYVANSVDPDTVKPARQAVDTFVTDLLNKAGEHRPTVERGLVIVGAVVGWLWYTRLVGGVRKAIRGWLEQNEPAV